MLDNIIYYSGVLALTILAISILYAIAMLISHTYASYKFMRLFVKYQYKDSKHYVEGTFRYKLYVNWSHFKEFGLNPPTRVIVNREHSIEWPGVVKPYYPA